MSSWHVLCLIVPLSALLHSQNSRTLVPGTKSTNADSTVAAEQWLSYLRRPFMTWVPLNSSCISSKGRQGKCTFPSSCTRRVFLAEGWCVKPVQVCCVASITCGGEAGENNTYFVNPAYPQPNEQILDGCHIKVSFKAREICQLRLELEILELSPPNGGVCKQDLMSVSGCNHNTFLPVICGLNNGQHMIIDVSSVEGPVSVCMTLNGLFDRLWKVRIIYIGCSHPMLAPKGCLQYFTEPVGHLFSFNLEAPEEHAGYMNNLNYAMCLRRNAHYCGFTLAADLFDVGTNSSVVTTDSCCSSDFVQLPPGRVIVGGNNRPIPARICGSVFGCLKGLTEPQSLTIDTQGPLVIYFSSGEKGPKGKGFKLSYIMNPCLIL